MPKPTKYNDKSTVYFWDRDKEDAVEGTVERIYIYKDTNTYLLSTKDEPAIYDSEGMHCRIARDEDRLFPSRLKCLGNQLKECNKHVLEIKKELKQAMNEADYLRFLLYCEKRKKEIKNEL